MSNFAPRRFGSYILTDILGEGGAGRVFQGYRSSTDIKVPYAIKILLEKNLSSLRYLNQFREEALLASRKVLECVHMHDLDPGGAKGGAHPFEHCENRAVGFDHHDALCAARRGLEAERAAAGERIQAHESGERLAEPVEQRLAHAVRRGPQPGAIGHRDAPATVHAADDADFPFKMHRSMVATSWAARLKAGLARTRDVLNTPVSELFTRRTVDEALYEELLGSAGGA